MVGLSRLLLSWAAPSGPAMLWGSPGHQKGQTWVFEVTGGINYQTRSSHLHDAVTPKPAWTAEPQAGESVSWLEPPHSR